MKTKPINASRFLFILYVVLLMLLSVIPIFGNLNKTKINLAFELRLDYILHFFAYCCFYVIFILSYILKQPIFFKNSFLKISLVVFILAITTESIQWLVPSRTFNPYDMLANISGMLAGGIASFTVIFLNSKRD